MATHFMLAHKAVPHGCRHLLFTTMGSTILTSPAMTPVSPHSAAGQQKQTSHMAITAALKAVSQHLCCNRRIVRALAFHWGRWGVRPKSPVTPQPPRLVDLLYWEDPHILCFREACQQPSLPSLFGMPYGHSLSCKLIRRYHMGAVIFCLLLCVPRYQLAQTPASPHGAAGQHKQTPPLSTGPLARSCSSGVGHMHLAGCSARQSRLVRVGGGRSSTL